MGQKYLWVKNVLVNKNSGCKIILWQQIFGSWRKFWEQKFGTKTFGTKNNFWVKTRLISIESQPKKIVVVVLVVIGVVGVHVVVDDIPVVDPRNIPFKFG